MPSRRFEVHVRAWLRGFLWAALALAPGGAGLLGARGAEAEPVSRVADLSLTIADTAGREHAVFQLGGAKARVFVFIMNDCPVANIYAPEIRRIFQDCSPKGMPCYLVYTDPDVTVDEVRRHAKEYGHSGYPLIFDQRHRIVEATGATQTPQAVVVGPEGRILYSGRIDNRYAALGRARRRATVEDLRRALDEIEAGRPVTVARTKPVGCYIPPLKDSPN